VLNFGVNPLKTKKSNLNFYMIIILTDLKNYILFQVFKYIKNLIVLNRHKKQLISH
jgi:hypothetical protein